MIDELRQRFETNIERARTFLTFYGERSTMGSGRPGVQTSDLLRAAVVFTHAAVEDLLRATAYARLPHADPEHLNSMRIPLPGKPNGAEKVTLAQLADYRDRTVQELIEEAVDSHLEYATYNNVGEIERLLVRLGLDPSPWSMKERGHIGALMARRHQIVHRVDWNPMRGQGHHQAVSLQRRTVETWLDMAARLGSLVLDQVQRAEEDHE